MWANAAKMGPEAWYEMYVKPWHPEFELGMFPLKSFLRHRASETGPPHWHIDSKICNRLEPETTEKLVYIYSNSKMVETTRDVDELKMFTWDIGDVLSPGGV